MFNLIKYYQRRQENINAGEIIDYLKFCLAQAPDISDINLLIIIYDVKRIAKVLKVSRCYLSWVQNSVFE